VGKVSSKKKLKKKLKVAGILMGAVQGKN